MICRIIRGEASRARGPCMLILQRGRSWKSGNLCDLVLQWSEKSSLIIHTAHYVPSVVLNIAAIPPSRSPQAKFG
jgi:hypothetical protein